MKSNYVQVSLTNYMIPVDFEVPSNHQREAEDSCMISKLIYSYWHCIHAIFTYSPINLIDFYTGNIIFAWAVYVRKHWAYGHSRGKHLNRFSVQEMVVTRWAHSYCISRSSYGYYAFLSTLGAIMYRCCANYQCNPGLLHMWLSFQLNLKYRATSFDTILVLFCAI